MVLSVQWTSSVICPHLCTNSHSSICFPRLLATIFLLNITNFSLVLDHSQQHTSLCLPTKKIFFFCDMSSVANHLINRFPLHKISKTPIPFLPALFSITKIMEMSRSGQCESAVWPLWDVVTIKITGLPPCYRHPAAPLFLYTQPHKHFSLLLHQSHLVKDTGYFLGDNSQLSILTWPQPSLWPRCFILAFEVPFLPLPSLHFWDNIADWFSCFLTDAAS